MTVDHVLFDYQKAIEKRLQSYALPVSLVLGVLLLFVSLVASAQDEIETYRTQAAQRLEQKIQLLE